MYVLFSFCDVQMHNGANAQMHKCTNAIVANSNATVEPPIESSVQAGDMTEVQEQGAEQSSRKSTGRVDKRPVLTAKLLQQIIVRTHKGSTRALILLVKVGRCFGGVCCIAPLYGFVHLFVHLVI